MRCLFIPSFHLLIFKSFIRAALITHHTEHQMFSFATTYFSLLKSEKKNIPTIENQADFLGKMVCESDYFNPNKI